VVNGPGEAKEADIGIAAGDGKGMIFRNGEKVRQVLEHEMVDALMEEIDRWEKENPAKMANGAANASANSRKQLPIISPLKPVANDRR
jgi:(E)-4-hydroxy-3-methylbut-2-enyl-diphosphate synthase